MKHFLYLGSIACMFMLGACSSSDDEPRPIPDPESVTELTFRVENNEAWLDIVPSSMTDVVIPSEITIGGKTYPVTTIGGYAFHLVEHLNSLTIPSSIRTIRGGAFETTTVSNLYIDDIASWCNIGFGIDYYFDTAPGAPHPAGNPISHETRLYVAGEEVTENLTIPSGVTVISAYAFSDLNVGGTLTLPEGLTDIEICAFSGTGFKEVKFPQNLKTIGWCTFSYSEIETVYLPQSLETIEADAFSNCKIISLTLPQNLKTVEWNAFSNCNITSLTLPQSIETIEHGAFSNCNITSLTLPESLKSIGSSAFAGNPITKINIPSLESWLNIKRGYVSNSSMDVMYTGMPFDSKYQLFVDDQPLDEIVIPSEISEIDIFAFYNCQLISVTIPETVTKINPHAFDRCVDLETLNISEEGESLYLCSFAFHACGFKSLSLPSRCHFDTFFGLGYVFALCNNLESVELGEGISDLYDFTFEKCISLKEIKFPSTLKSVSKNVFSQCFSLPEVIFPEGCEKVSHSLEYCRNLEYVSYPSSITSVDEYYRDCDSLKVIEVKAVNVPASNYGPINSQVAANCTLYVPMESIEAYKADEYWGQFQHIEGKDF